MKASTHTMVSRGRLFAASILVCMAGSSQAQQTPNPKPLLASPKAQPQRLGPELPPGFQPPDDGPQLNNVRGSVMKLFGATLEIGLDDGGIALFDVATKHRTLYVPGEGQSPAQDATMLGNRAWWFLQGAQFIRTAGPGMSRPYDIDLSNAGLVGPIRRLGVWQEMIVVHADNGIVFVDPETERILSPEQVLPPAVPPLARQ